MNKTKRIILLSALAILGILIGIYTINPNRWRTQDMLETKGKHTGKDFMLSSLNVTTIAQDNEKLIWIGTSAGINVYNGNDYIQFFHNSEDSTALPDDYINVLHRDRKGRMWIGTQNGLARYEGGYRFHRFTLPTSNGNIQEIEDAHQGAVTVSNGQEHFLIKGNEVKKMDSSKQYSDDKNSLKKIKEKKRRKIGSHLKEWSDLYPDFLLSLNKPKQLISNTFKDAGGNLWIGYRNAGYQVISENVMAYKYANRNPLADATRGMDIIAMQTVGNHILAGTTLRLFVYEAKKGEPKYYYYENNSSLNNIVPLDNDRVWLVANNHIKSCRLLPGNQLSTTGTFRSSAVLGCGTRQANDVYASCQAPYVIKYPFGTDHADRIAYRNTWYDAETQLTTLQNGSILLFMKNMHLALLSPATGKITDLEVNGARMVMRSGCLRRSRSAI